MKHEGEIRTTVFCAVWHGDPLRWELLKGHADNLARQTTGIKTIYVFDGADDPPDWLEGQKISVSGALTIYQAWNVALSLCDTPLVMNLNLDDRLAPDAVALLERAILSGNAVLAGGDWKICYTQAETDSVCNCYAAKELPFVDEWPLRCGTVTRFGSGTGERDAYGPATMWRMDAHIGAPRYPWRFADGDLIQSAGDAAWWSLIKGHLKGKAVRLPAIIGNYHSHPETQAEFRSGSDEPAKMKVPGISLL